MGKVELAEFFFNDTAVWKGITHCFLCMSSTWALILSNCLQQRNAGTLLLLCQQAHVWVLWELPCGEGAPAALLPPHTVFLQPNLCSAPCHCHSLRGLRGCPRSKGTVPPGWTKTIFPRHRVQLSCCIPTSNQEGWLQNSSFSTVGKLISCSKQCDDFHLMSKKEHLA